MNTVATIAAVEGAAGPIILWIIRAFIKQLVVGITEGQTKTLVANVDRIVSEKIESHIKEEHNGRP